MTERRLPPGMTPRLLSRFEAAAYCGLPPNSFEQTIGQEIRRIRFGRRVLWDVKALDRWIDRQTFITKTSDRPVEPGDIDDSGSSPSIAELLNNVDQNRPRSRTRARR
jgi:hypothetical protein